MEPTRTPNGPSKQLIPLFGIGEPNDHQGVVVGGLLDSAFKFNP